ncbi:MAG: UDP-N-acetylmuramate--L-alanine ligase [Chloroflexi bacterium]|nr:UDP-N-acetylmuramate--L-alanine ligase [Chloroflexota bacterium]
MLFPGKRIHIVGVGGFGMSAIARVLLQQEYQVSGSDLQANTFTRELAALGAVIHIGHAAENVTGAELVVISSAIPADNPEVVAARAAQIPVLRRRDMLGELMMQKIGVAVAGTHGKTTTTAMITHLLLEAGHDPTYIIGGVLRSTGTNAGVGRGDHFVIEADEYDRMFLGLRPKIAVVTNIEHDHPDCYPTLDNMVQAFELFIERLPEQGLLIVCADDTMARRLGELRCAAGSPTVFYGLTGLSGAEGDWFADDIQPDDRGGMRFTVRRGDEQAGPVRVNLPGRHNVQNALAALAVTHQLGLSLEQAATALDTFPGTGRRSEPMGTAGGVTVINDYAHHPTEIRVTLAAQREQPGVNRLWAVWQPHTYGRLRTLANDFAQAFAAADHVLVTDVYSVRENPAPGLDGAGIVAMIATAGHADARYTGSLEATAAILAEHVRPGDRVVLLSAGDAPQIGERLLRHLGAGS